MSLEASFAGALIWLKLTLKDLKHDLPSDLKMISAPAGSVLEQFGRRTGREGFNDRADPFMGCASLGDRLLMTSRLVKRLTEPNGGI